eukprot:gene13896-19822_t
MHHSLPNRLRPPPSFHTRTRTRTCTLNPKLNLKPNVTSDHATTGRDGLKNEDRPRSIGCMAVLPKFSLFDIITYLAILSPGTQELVEEGLELLKDSLQAPGKNLILELKKCSVIAAHDLERKSILQCVENHLFAGGCSTRGDWAPDYHYNVADTHIYGAARWKKQNHQENGVPHPVGHAKAYARPKYRIGIALSKFPASEDGGEIADSTSYQPFKRSTTCHALDKMGTGSKDQRQLYTHEEDGECNTSYSHSDMQPPSAPKASKGVESSRALKPVKPQQGKLQGLGPCHGAVEVPHLRSEVGAIVQPGTCHHPVLAQGDHFSAAALVCANKILSKIEHPGMITYVPVKPDSFAFVLGTSWSFSAFVISYGSSYFQRLVASIPQLELVVRQDSSYAHYMADVPLRYPSADRLELAANNDHRSTLDSIMFTCIYLAAKLVDSTEYHGKLQHMLSRIYGVRVESKCLNGLQWRLGPFFYEDDLTDWEEIF